MQEEQQRPNGTKNQTKQQVDGRTRSHAQSSFALESCIRRHAANKPTRYAGKGTLCNKRDDYHKFARQSHASKTWSGAKVSGPQPRNDRPRKEKKSSDAKLGET